MRICKAVAGGILGASLLVTPAPKWIAHHPTVSNSFGGGAALAQSDQVKAKAREMFMQGVDHFDSGRYEDARTAFLQAYALTRHPAVLLNLGQSELKGKHVESGGNHLQQFLREHKSATAAQKAAANAGIAEARRRTGFVILIVDRDGAQLAIDGQPVGTSPLVDPVFVKPNKHQASATIGSRTARVDFTAKRGTATPVSVNLGGGSGAVIAPLPTPAPAAPAAAVPEPTSSPSPYQPVGPTPLDGPGFEPDAPDHAKTKRPNIIDWGWGNKEPVFFAGAGLAAANLIATIAFGAAAAEAQSAATKVENDIIAKANERGDTNTPPLCGEFDDPNSGDEFYRGACDQLRANIDAYDTDVALAVTGAVLTVLAVGGTFTYWYIDTSKKKKHSAESGPGTFMLVAPVISHEQQGLGLVGTF